MEKVLLAPDDARRLLTLYESAEAAERHFHACQSAQYRAFLRTVWNTEAMSQSAGRVKAALDALTCDGAPAGGEPAKKAPGARADGGRAAASPAGKEEKHGYHPA